MGIGWCSETGRSLSFMFVPILRRWRVNLCQSPVLNVPSLLHSQWWMKLNRATFTCGLTSPTLFITLWSSFDPRLCLLATPDVERMNLKRRWLSVPKPRLPSSSTGTRTMNPGSSLESSFSRYPHMFVCIIPTYI